MNMSAPRTASARRCLSLIHICIGHEPCHILNTVVGKRVTGRDIDVELLCEVTVTQVESMALLAVQLRITLADVHYSEKERSRTIGVVLTDKTQAGGLTVYELLALGRQPHTGFFGRLHPKDHVTGHNPAAALYTANSYYRKKLMPGGEQSK